MKTELQNNTEPCWIGIDQSYGGFGVVLLYADGYQTKLWAFKPNGSEAGRLNEIHKTLLDLFRHLPSDECYPAMAMEGYAHGAKFNREKLGELGGLVKLAWYEIMGTDPTVISPTALKKYVTGKGTASKADMVKGVQTKWGVDITDNNLADAYGLAQMLKEQLDG